MDSTSKDAAITELQELILQRDRELYSIEQSYSWKITAPIRQILNLLLRIKNVLDPVTISNGITVLRNHGFRSFLKQLYIFLKQGNRHQAANQYRQYVEMNKVSELQKKNIREEIKSWPYQPLISVVLPSYNAASNHLDQCITSVANQVYENWELCIHDDASTNNETISTLKRWNSHQQVRVTFSDKNQHISLATNKAIETANGEYIGLLDHDDLLHPTALYEVVKTLNQNKELDFIYSDEDKVDARNNRHGPYFKSDFDPDLLLSNNYICHFAALRKSIGDKIGWFRKGFEGAQDHDLFLRFIEHTKHIHHIPKVLYSWRQAPGSTSTNHKAKAYAEKAGKRAIQDYLKRNKITADVESGPWGGSYHVKREIISYEQVAIIIPFKDQLKYLKRCINSILNKTLYPNYKIVLINNHSKKPETLDYLNSIRNDKVIELIDYNKEFNFAALNNYAVQQLNTPYLLLLNNDTEVINGNWLNEMVSHIQREDVGAVGAELWYEDNTIQHAGVVLGIGSMAGHAFRHFPSMQHRHFSQGLTRQYSAVTAACMLTKRSIYQQVGGMDEENFKIALNDIDFCLKIRNAGYKIIFTPEAKLYHFESKSRGYEDTPEKIDRFKEETKRFRKKWKGLVDHDPFYNPNLTLEAENFSLKVTQ